MRQRVSICSDKLESFKDIKLHGVCMAEVLKKDVGYV